MDTTAIILAYPDSGNEIRTIHKGDDVMFCLPDVVRTLHAQNVKLATPGDQPQELFGLVKSQLDVLDDDECLIMGNVSDAATHDSYYITQPGLFRLILRDKSQACKRFQRWVLHDVLPSIQKYGTYPPPSSNQDSELKAVVKSLLSEIEERERLEKETKTALDQHGRILNKLSLRLASSEASYDQNDFQSIQQFSAEKGLDATQEQLVFGWCIKICAEKGEPSAKQIINDEEVVVFPYRVLWEALKELGIAAEYSNKSAARVSRSAFDAALDEAPDAPDEFDMVK